MNNTTGLLNADLHCHSTLKPFGKTFKNNHPKNNSNPTSLWFYNPPSLADKISNYVLGISTYTQSDFFSCIKGNTLLLGVSLYAPEVGFFNNKLGKGEAQDMLENIITQFGLKRIEQIQSKAYNYFTDLCEQYEFLKQLNGKTISINNKQLLLHQIITILKIY